MSIENFDSSSSELKTGVNLIEASAGTGKTYAIAMLVLRFVVEKGLKIEQLLVVTFTKAATEELKDRIRARLAEAKQAAYGRRENVEDTVIGWLDELEIDEGLIKQRLEAALLNIDRAGIFTIHGFCQRILSEHALESGQLFNFELTSDIYRVKLHCTDDYWRRQVYARPPLEVSLLTSHYATPEALLDSVKTLLLWDNIVPEVKDLDEVLGEVTALISKALQQYGDCRQKLQQSFADEKFKVSHTEKFAEFSKELEDWLQGNSLPLPNPEVLGLFSDNGIADALNGNKFRKTKEKSSAERKNEYIAELNLDNDAFNALESALKNISLHFRLGLVQDLCRSVDVHLQQLKQLSFDDLINRLSTALKKDQQKLLTQALRQRFHVALIDEFQDTDDQQWEIFSTLFAGETQYMYLIGDPKQAIYKFRGADIFSYFTAKDTAQHHFTLGYNWRSHPNLVDGVNRLFARDNAFLFGQLAFNDVNAARRIENGDIQYRQQRIAPMMLWQLEQNEGKSGHWSAGKASTEIQVAVVNEILSLLNNDFSLKSGNVETNLRPRDIAVLVRSNRQAREYQALLQRQGIPAVLNSIESVFTSKQAFELYQLLQAIEATGDMQCLKQALTLDWFGMDGQTFHALVNDETRLDDWVSRFAEYHILWQRRGIMAMMLRLLENERVHTHLSALPLAERILCNLHHLIELLQQVESEQHLGMQKTLEYLAGAIQEAENGSNDEQQLRLESDDEAVKIVTMHRSKGLEYAVVFCPFLWQSNDYLKNEKELIKCHSDIGMVSDLGSPDFETHRQQAIEEQLAEDLRILYVALTRAKYRCYIAYADVRTKDVPNRSALAYLLEFDGGDFEYQRQQLQSFKSRWPETFDYQLLEKGQGIDGVYRVHRQMAKVYVRERTRNLETHWQMSSYTALATLSREETPELPEDKAQEHEPAIDNDGLMFELPRGSHTGNVIHSLLEFNSFKKLVDPETDISQQRDRTCQRYGLRVEQPEIIDQLLQRVVRTPLSLEDERFCLKNIEHWQCIKEMPFYLAVDALEIDSINHLLSGCPAYKPLEKNQLAGYLTGFIDLICEYDGRYYVMDYKTNHLPDYHPDSMTAAMREHNYGLQYWLYSVVLHLYLKQRLQGYDHARHFGGVRYLFVRGMQAEQPLSGVYEDLPDLETLQALAAVFE